VDYDSDLHEPRTNAEQSETGDDFRVSFESPQRAADGRLYYFEHQVQLKPGYSGPLERCSPDEVRALFCEMLDRTEVCSQWDWPLPPAGLPGYVGYGYERDAPEAELLKIGIRYVHAVVNNERKAMHNRWADAAEFVYEIEKKVGERIQRKLADRQMRAALAEAKKRAASNRVYFIASESGPIKIGKARSPKKRLKSLQTGHHEKLQILAWCWGGEEVEKAYHKRFDDRRLNGEWFERCPEILAEIDRLNKHQGNDDD
jgi:hypothetical protein